jgi:hypothetical protein
MRGEGIRRTVALLTAGVLGCAAFAAGALERNGFDLTDALVPASEIFHGGPPKDGIPSIDRPKFVAAREAGYLAPDSRVLGVARGGLAKAYPVAILNWHEVVNDRFGDESVVVTFCPLCGTGMVFRAEVEGRALRFGVSGLLYNSDVLLYDRQTQSLWSQVRAQAVTGPMKGARLEMLPVAHTAWSDWRARHPQTLVLSTDTGHRRDYARNPYRDYETSSEILFPVAFRAQGYHPKERVLGIVVNGKSRAYPFVELGKTEGKVKERVGGAAITVRFDRGHQSAVALDAGGRELPAVIAFWFAWYAFHPDTEVFKAGP